ncbi:MAG: hypothetical protein KGL97_15315, partial [Alphaproteobacteria bacterium]|nr:hypothetical protein [Alphaproteobacteria bacterium]
MTNSAAEREIRSIAVNQTPLDVIVDHLGDVAHRKDGDGFRHRYRLHECPALVRNSPLRAS